MAGTGPRIKREKNTIKAMIKIYCNLHHGTKDSLCKQCQELQEYAMLRLDKCKFSEEKPTCGKCPIHCYKPEMRKKVVEVMKFAGPIMSYHHPVMAINHIIDGIKRKK